MALILGYNTIGGSDTGTATSLGVFGCKFTSTEAGRIFRVWYYIRSTGVAEFRGAVYSDVSGVPTDLMAQSAAATALDTNFAWRSVDLTYDFAANETLWLCCHCSDNMLLKFDAGSTNQAYLSNNVAYPDWNDPESVQLYDAGELSIYAEYTNGSKIFYRKFHRPALFKPGNSR